MNLRDLQYLVAIADLGHFGKAAERCHVSQPTLSMQVKKLAEILGVQLFEHTSKTIQLTPVAKQIVSHARNIIGEVDQIKQIARASKDGEASELSIGLPYSLGPYLLPLFIDELRARYPKIILTLVEEKNVKLIRRVENGRLDCAFLMMPVDREALDGVKLFEEPFYVAVSPTHELAKEKSVTLSDVERYSVLLLDETPCLQDGSLELCKYIGVGEASTFRSTSLETVRQMVAKGGHITIVPKLAVQPDDTHINYIPFKSPAPTRTIGLYWRKTTPRQEFLNDFQAWLSLTLQKKIV